MNKSRLPAALSVGWALSSAQHHDQLRWIAGGDARSPEVILLRIGRRDGLPTAPLYYLITLLTGVMLYRRTVEPLTSGGPRATPHHHGDVAASRLATPVVTDERSVVWLTGRDPS